MDYHDAILTLVVCTGTHFVSVVYRRHTQLWRDSDCDFADNTAIMATSMSTEHTTVRLQSAINAVKNRMKKWLTKLNETNSTYITSTNKRVISMPKKWITMWILLNVWVWRRPDSKLFWNEHTRIKGKEQNIDLRKLDWLHGRRSKCPSCCFSTSEF